MDAVVLVKTDLQNHGLVVQVNRLNCRMPSNADMAKNHKNLQRIKIPDYSLYPVPDHLMNCRYEILRIYV